MLVRVRSIPDTFRRAGMKFGKQPEEYDVDAEKLKILKAEPMLVVEILPEKAPEKTDPIDKSKPAASAPDAKGKVK